MSKEQSNQQGNGAKAGDGNDAGDLEQLSRKFSEFRGKHQRPMRIPEDLQEAALEAIGKGIPEKSVREACRISSGQLNRWREIHWVRGRKKGGQKAKARVFEVVDAPLEKEEPNSQKEPASEPVHLRIGGWEIFIRQVAR